MTCPRCHAENRDGLRFCEDCGSRLTLTCAQCGGDLALGKRFCGSCGAPAAGQPTPRTPSPESYTPKHLAERILTSRAALEGERKQVTVLFADLKGSMELLADRDPEEARKLLDPVLEHMMEAVHRYEGTVNQVMGDGIMALFGAPLAHEDHAVRACYAALDLQTAIRRYAEDARRSHGVVIQIRVGLNSGEVVVRAIGSDLRMDYTAVGQTTHLAARMEQLAKPDSTLLTADVLRLAEGFIAVTPLGAVPVKGLSAPVEVYEMTGAGPLRSRLHAAASRGLTRFVGRVTELEQLRQSLARAAAGHGQVVAIVGEPGVGKSRLVWEVTHSHRVHGWLVLQAGSASYGKATSYLPVVHLLKGYFGIEDRDGPRAVHEKLTGKLLTLDRTQEGSLPALLSLLDVATDDSHWAGLDPRQRRRCTLDAVKRLLLRESQVQPLLLVFEDLHWIDSETQALLDELVESLPAARLLLLVNYRPEYHHSWGSRTYYTQLRVDPLPPETAEQLLNMLLGPDPGLDPLKRTLIAQTEGNPFFLEESVRTLVETGSLSGERGGYRLARPLLTIQVPSTVQAVLAARIDRLSPEQKQLLQSAAVVGKDIPVALLKAIAELPEEALDRELAHLQAAEFLYETRLPPDREYTFKHALTHAVTYGSLLHDRRRTLHEQIVNTIEQLYSERLPEHIERLAHHAFRGEAWETAVTYLRQAGAKAMRRSVHREAVTCLEQAVTALAHLPQTRERLEQGVDVRFELRYALSPLGEWQRALEYVAEARTLAETLGDQLRLGWALANMASPLNSLGDHGHAIDASERALTIADAVKDFGLRVDAVFYLAISYGSLGNYRRAATLLTDTIGALVGEWTYWGTPGISSVLLRAYLGWYLSLLGWFPEAIRHIEKAMRIAEDAAQPYSRIYAHAGAGQVYLNQGDIPRAIPLLERSIQLSEASDLPSLRPWVTASLGLAYARTGRVSEAMSLAAELARLADLPPGRAWPVMLWLGETYVAVGHVAEALPFVDRALNLARGSNEQGREAQALHLQGELAAHRDPPDMAEAHCRYMEALALADTLAILPLVAHCHLGLGKLYRRTGDQAKAEEHLASATVMYREMGMAFWLDKAEAVSAGGAP